MKRKIIDGKIERKIDRQQYRKIDTQLDRQKDRWQDRMIDSNNTQIARHKVRYITIEGKEENNIKGRQIAKLF